MTTVLNTCNSITNCQYVRKTELYSTVQRVFFDESPLVEHLWKSFNERHPGRNPTYAFDGSYTLVEDVILLAKDILSE